LQGNLNTHPQEIEQISTTGPDGSVFLFLCLPMSKEKLIDFIKSLFLTLGYKKLKNSIVNIHVHCTVKAISEKYNINRWLAIRKICYVNIHIHTYH
jgi:hypothetical protein